MRMAEIKLTISICIKDTTSPINLEIDTELTKDNRNNMMESQE